MRLLNSSWSLLLLLSTVTACSPKPKAAEFTKELKTVTSWAATVHLVGDSWLRDTIPTTYAKQTLQKTQQELQKETHTLAKVTPERDRMKVSEQLQRLRHTVREMTVAVERKNRNMMNQQLQLLSSQEQALNALLGAKGGQS